MRCTPIPIDSHVTRLDDRLKRTGVLSLFFALSLLYVVASLAGCASPSYAKTLTHSVNMNPSNPASIPRTWVDPTTGTRYELTSVRDLSTDSRASSETKSFEAQSTRIKVPSAEVTPTPTAALKARFPQVAGVDEDAFIGAIPLWRIETFPVVEALKRQVEREVEVTASSNDIEDLPSEMLFDTSSGEQMLRRASVSFEVIERDGTQTQRGDDGMPTAYRVTMIFRGVEEYNDITHYEAIAHYRGSVTRVPFDGGPVEATYVHEEESTSTVPGVGAATPVSASGPGSPSPAAAEHQTIPQSSNVPVPAAIAAASTAIAIIAFGATRNGRVAAQGLSGLRTLGYTHIKRTANGYECAVPSWINLPKRIYQEERAVVVPSKRLRDKEGVLTVHWRDTVLYRGDLARRIALAVPSASTLSYARRKLRGRLTALAAGGAAFAILAVITVSVLNTMIKV